MASSVSSASSPHGRRNGAVESALVSVKGLERHFPPSKVIGPVDFALRRGERLALLGPNGGGKSTILRCLAGTLEATAGAISIGGYLPGSMQARTLIGVSLSQERSFDLRLSGRDNLAFFARLRLVDRRAAAEAVAAIEEELELADIAVERVANCSTGMTQQLSFARSLLGDPQLLLLDEPTRSLDADAHERLWGALERRPGLAAVVATHREEDLAHCDERLQLAP